MNDREKVIKRDVMATTQNTENRNAGERRKGKNVPAAGTRISAIFTTGRPHGRASGGMTMDLIDRAAAIDAIVSISIYEDEGAIRRACSSSAFMEKFWIGGVNDAIETIKEVNAVEAVPLDKLCELLGKFANPCKIGIRCHYPEDCMPTVECWRYVLKKWMEGLDAAD